MITGKGIYIWKIKECEGGNISNIVTLCKNANFSHVLIKIADGVSGYNFTAEDGDMAKALADALKVAGIEPYGWQYIYGNNPVREAEVANKRIEETGVVKFVINAEQQIRDIDNNDAVAIRYLNELNIDLPWGLSSYRYPEVHPNFPWDEFMGVCDFIMPQVYWMQANNPGEQLVECVEQYRKFTDLPIYPTGSAFAEHGWSPTNAEIIEFADTAKSLGIDAINFWELGVTKKQGYWKTVRDIEYEVGTEVPPPPVDPPVETDDCDEVMKALNEHIAIHNHNMTDINGDIERLKESVSFWFTDTDLQVAKNENDIETLRQREIEHTRDHNAKIERLEKKIDDNVSDINTRIFGLDGGHTHYSWMERFFIRK